MQAPATPNQMGGMGDGLARHGSRGSWAIPAAAGDGGRGGGSFSGMLGGIGGAIAGNWLYDQFSGRHSGMDSADGDPPAIARPTREETPSWEPTITRRAAPRGTTAGLVVPGVATGAEAAATGAAAVVTGVAAAATGAAVAVEIGKGRGY